MAEIDQHDIAEHRARARSTAREEPRAPDLEQTAASPTEQLIGAVGTGQITWWTWNEALKEGLAADMDMATAASFAALFVLAWRFVRSLITTAPKEES